LDIDEKGRNLPYIASVDLEKYQALQREGRLVKHQSSAYANFLARNHHEKIKTAKMTKRIGVLTAGSDCPGLECRYSGHWQSRPLGFGMELVGFHDGFQGLVQNHVDPPALSGF
jgi:hypothetical protein